MHGVVAATSDPYAKVRSLGVTAIVLLALRAGMRALTYGVFRIFAPTGQALEAEQFELLRTIDTVLLGVENLLGLAAMIVFLVWVHAVFVAARKAGVATRTSPGMAVGGWFIPLANVVLPCLSVREALVSVRRPGALAIVWWLVWLANIPLLGLHQTFRQMALVPELAGAIPVEDLGKVYELLDATAWPFFLADTLAWGLLAGIVAMVRTATLRR